jgi:hypothetical protein
VSQHIDRLSLPEHAVLEELLVTSIVRRHAKYAAAIVRAMLKLRLDINLQPGVRFICCPACWIAEEGAL